jgi:hypothetical protein
MTVPVRNWPSPPPHGRARLAGVGSSSSPVQVESALKSPLSIVENGLMNSNTHANCSVNGALAFLPGVAERLGFYVYALRDPRIGQVFYVGKGVGDRVYQHARNAKASGESAKGAKLATIREVHNAGLEVGVEIIRPGSTRTRRTRLKRA